MTKRWAGALFLSAFTATGIQAASVWERPSSSWSEADARLILTKSPWAGNGRIRYSAMQGARATPISRTALVSWASALPMRQARMRLGPEQTELAVARPFPVYAVTLELSNTSLSSLTNDRRNSRPHPSLLTMRAATFLRRKTKPPIAAVEAHVWSQYDTERDRFSGVLLFVFPASDPITLADQEVTFVTKVCGMGWVPGTVRQDCTYDIQKTFKLKEMVVNGELMS